MKKIQLKLMFFIMAFMPLIGSGQTNPTAQTLPYTQDFTSLTGTSPVYPAGWQGWTIAGSMATTVATAAPTADQAISTATNASTVAFIGDMVGKLGILSTGSNIRAATLAIVTTNTTAINVSFTAATQAQLSAGRVDELQLQYRVGTSGVFTTVTGSTYQNNATSTINTGTAASNASTVSVTLPVACENQAVVQLRWTYRDVTGSGNRPSFSIDNISVTGTANAPSITTNTTGFNGSFGTITVGTPSAPSSYTVSGANLTNNITVTPPAGGFEISTNSGGPFSSSAITLTQTAGVVAATAIYVRFNPATSGVQSGNITNTSTGATSINIPVSGTGFIATPPTKLAITAISPISPIINTSFSITVQSQDGTGTPQNVSANTDFTLSVNTGTGSLGGTITGTILAGTNSIVISGINYSTAETGVVITATRTAGDILSSGNSTAFNVLGVATYLSFTTTPTGGTISTNLSTVTIKALRADNSVDPNYTGNVTLSINTGSTGTGNLSSVLTNLTKAMVAGIVSFTDLQIDQMGNYMINANSGTLASATSTSILISAPPAISDIIVPQYIQGISGTNNSRVPYVFRVKLSNLKPNATYRFMNQVVLSTDLPNAAGGGNMLIYNASGTFARVTTASLSTAGGYGTFTTSAIGEYTGWFITEPTGSTRFAVGSQLYMRIILNDGTGGTTAATYLTTTNYASVINFATTATANDGSGIYGLSQSTNGNLVMLYDNVAGTGRPISATFVENDGTSGATAYSTFYQNNVDAVASAWGSIVPNNLSNGIQRIDFLDANANKIYSNTSANGMWGSINTVNPNVGATALFIDRTIIPSDFILNKDLTLLSSININGQLNLNTYNLTLGSNDATIAPNGSIIGWNNGGVYTGNYIHTNSTGAVKLTVDAITKQYVPVGNSTINYVKIKNDGAGATPDVFSFRVVDDIFDGGNSGTSIASSTTTPVVSHSWIIGQDGSGVPNANISLEFNASQINSSFDLNHAYIVHHNGTLWENFLPACTPTPCSAASNAPAVDGAALGIVGYEVALGNVTNFSPFGVASASTTGTPLGLTLKSITAENKGSFNNAKWTTINESNFKNFELQRSKEGNNFNTIAVIPALGYAHEYVYNDEKPFNGNNFYRLKIIENNGKTTYSNTVQTQLYNQFYMEILPMPISNKMTINVNAAFLNDATLTITNITGQVLKSLKLNLSSTDVDMSEMPSGVYFVKYNDLNHSEVVKIEKL